MARIAIGTAMDPKNHEGEIGLERKFEVVGNFSWQQNWEDLFPQERLECSEMVHVRVGVSRDKDGFEGGGEIFGGGGEWSSLDAWSL